MSNMSYCRFRNTAADLDDCKDALERLLAGEVDEDGDKESLSREELRAAKSLVKTCQDIIAILNDHACNPVEDDSFADYDFDDCLDQANQGDTHD